MIDLIDTRLTPLLLLLADWSLRWAVVLAALAMMLKLRPPRRPATRLLLCRLALVGGLLFPLLPHWWRPVSFPAESAAITSFVGEDEAKQPPPIIRTIPPSPDSRLAEAPPFSSGAEPLPDEQTPAQSLTEPPVSFRSLRWFVLALAAVWMGGAAVMMIRLLAAGLYLRRLGLGSRQRNPHRQGWHVSPQGFRPRWQGASSLPQGRLFAGDVRTAADWRFRLGCGDG